MGRNFVFWPLTMKYSNYLQLNALGLGEEMSINFNILVTYSIR